MLAYIRLELRYAFHRHSMSRVLPLPAVLEAGASGKHAVTESDEGFVELALERSRRMAVDRLQGFRLGNRDMLGRKADERPCPNAQRRCISFTTERTVFLV